MTTLTAEHALEISERGGASRERLPNRYIADVDFVLERAAASDQELERAIAILMTGLQDGTIQPAIGAKLLVSLVTAFKDVTRIYNVMKLLRESGMEVSQLEVSRIEAAKLVLTGQLRGVKS